LILNDIFYLYIPITVMNIPIYSKNICSKLKVKIKQNQNKLKKTAIYNIQAVCRRYNVVKLQIM